MKGVLLLALCGLSSASGLQEKEGTTWEEKQDLFIKKLEPENLLYATKMKECWEFFTQKGWILEESRFVEVFDSFDMEWQKIKLAKLIGEHMGVSTLQAMLGAVKSCGSQQRAMADIVEAFSPSLQTLENIHLVFQKISSQDFKTKAARVLAARVLAAKRPQRLTLSCTELASVLETSTDSTAQREMLQSLKDIVSPDDANKQVVVDAVPEELKGYAKEALRM